MNGSLDNQTSNQVYMATQTRDKLITRETQLFIKTRNLICYIYDVQLLMNVHKIPFSRKQLLLYRKHLLFS